MNGNPTYRQISTLAKAQAIFQTLAWRTTGLGGLGRLRPTASQASQRDDPDDK
jgi:hypothetical protein